MNFAPGSIYLWHGVTWASGAPALLLADISTGTMNAVDVMGLRIGVKAASDGRFCTGRYDFTGTSQVAPLPCPQQVPATSGGQCAACQEGDDFRFAHHAHKGGQVPAALTAYLDQPHLLYVATFADGASKVGTAAAPRRVSRLDEQGPMHATYLLRARDGRAVRVLEDTVGRDVGLAQAIRGSAKLAALIDPDPRRARAAHDAAVERALAALITRGHRPDPEEWTPPVCGAELRSPRRGERGIYPHDLREGEHGFQVDSCSGSHALVRLDTVDDVRYVLDLNSLKGCRALIGSYTSPAMPFQGSLFLPQLPVNGRIRHRLWTGPLMQPPDAVLGWDDDLNAQLYARFTRDYPFYAITSRDLAERASLAGADLVVDLCGGVGTTAAVLLETLAPVASVISIDAAKAMQAVGQGTLSDPRVKWVLARAEDVAQHIHEPADAAVCNSAIWKTDTPAVFAGVKQALRQGGRFVFNIGGSFAGLPPTRPDPRPGPSLNDLITTVATAQHGYRPSPDPRPPTPLTADIVRAQLSAAGFTVLNIETVTHASTLEEKRAWLSIPAFARPPGSFTYEQRMEILDRAYALADASQVVTTTWLVVTAEA